MTTKAIADFNPNLYIGQSVIALTYDDGLINHYKIAAPLHLRYGIPATFAIIANRLIQSEFHKRHFGPQRARHLSELGFEIASHGLNHRKTYPDMTDDEVEYDITTSKHILQEQIGTRIQSICVPFSACNKKVAGMLEKHYEHIRVRGQKYVNILHSGHLNFAFGLHMDMNIVEVRNIIDQAISTRQDVILTLHGITEQEPQGKHEISKTLLADILKTISGIDRRLLLPIRLRDISSIRAHHARTSSENRQLPQVELNVF